MIESFYLEKSEKYFAKKDFQMAIKYLEKIKNIETYDYLAMKSTGYYELGQLDKSKQVTKKILKLFPDEEQQHFNLGVMYYELKQYDSSITCFSNAIQLDSNFYQAYGSLGNSWYYLDQPDSAIKYLYLARNLNENDSMINYLLSGFFIEKGVTDSASKYLNIADNLGHDSIYSLFQKVRLNILRKNFDSSKIYLDKLKSIKTEDPILSLDSLERDVINGIEKEM